jgi:D-glycero-alpha-D-manno-heptose 1-phosphate guanylyltransferase
MITEAIILSGGMGTRLREAVPDLPKTLAPVACRPFLAYVIDGLRMQGIRRFIFSLGFRSEAVVAFLQEAYPTLDYTLVVEDEPLGTGGAISLALQSALTHHVLVANGDTLFRIDLEKLEKVHLESKARCTLALKEMQQFDRYGAVEMDANGGIQSFQEKRFFESGLINGGVYLLDREKLVELLPQGRFSFEKDYLEKSVGEGRLAGSIQEGYFIDIGIPEDWARAQQDLARPPLDLKTVDGSWTLFLDRDGVINEERVGEYVLRWDQFIFGPGVLKSFKQLSDRFGRVLVVSNQRGVGRSLMSEAELQSIHLEMQREVGIVGGRIDRIYYCTEKDDTCFFRKPNPGMAWMALSDFRDIDPRRSIMVGNKPSDMRFGRAAGFYTVFVRTTNPDQPFPHPDIDLVYPTLADFAAELAAQNR